MTQKTRKLKLFKIKPKNPKTVLFSLSFVCFEFFLISLDAICLLLFITRQPIKKCLRKKKQHFNFFFFSTENAGIFAHLVLSGGHLWAWFMEASNITHATLTHIQVYRDEHMNIFPPSQQRTNTKRETSRIRTRDQRLRNQVLLTLNYLANSIKNVRHNYFRNQILRNSSSYLHIMCSVFK